MKTCAWCGKVFDGNEAASYFSSEVFGLSYDNFRECLCGECAVQAIEEKADGVYFERCEKCGAEFDLVEDSSRFDDHFDWSNGTDLRDHWNPLILCCDCASEEIEEAAENDEEYASDYGDQLSVEDAAEIWASHGKDEDYTFGYSEDELEDA